jgi:hypothetical protein
MKGSVAASLLRPEYKDSVYILRLDPSLAETGEDETKAETKQLGTSIHLIKHCKAPARGHTPRICGTSSRRQSHKVSEESIEKPSVAVVEAIPTSMNVRGSSSATPTGTVSDSLRFLLQFAHYLLYRVQFSGTPLLQGFRSDGCSTPRTIGAHYTDCHYGRQTCIPFGIVDSGS